MPTSVADNKCIVYQPDYAMAIKARYKATKRSRQITAPHNYPLYTAAVLVCWLGKELAVQEIPPYCPKMTFAMSE